MYVVDKNSSLFVIDTRLIADTFEKFGMQSYEDINTVSVVGEDGIIAVRTADNKVPTY